MPESWDLDQPSETVMALHLSPQLLATPWCAPQIETFASLLFFPWAASRPSDYSFRFWHTVFHQLFPLGLYVHLFGYFGMFYIQYPGGCHSASYIYQYTNLSWWSSLEPGNRTRIEKSDKTSTCWKNLTGQMIRKRKKEILTFLK